MGLDDDRFWQLTLTEFWALVERHEEKLAREYTRSGAIAAAIYNVNLKKGSRTLGPADIFPSLNKHRSLPREASVAELDMMFQGIIAEFKKPQPDPSVYADEPALPGMDKNQ